MSVQLKQVDRGFEVRFQYNAQMVADIKTIKGAGWRGTFWHVPTYRKTELDMFLEKYGYMTEPVIQMPEQIGEIEPLPELTIDLNLKRDLFEFQKPGVAQGIIWKKFIIGDEMGLAKTATAIATSLALECRCTLVICTNVAKFNWQKEWQIVCGKKSIILGEDATSDKWKRYYELGMADVFIVNYESLKKFFVKPGWKKPKGRYTIRDIAFRECIDMFDCVIIDESQNVANADTMQSKFVRGIAKKKDVVIEMTGTLITNKVKDVAHQLLVIDQLLNVVSHIPMPMDEFNRPTDFTGWTRFMNRYCEGGEGACNLRELNYRLRKYCFFRRLKVEVIDDLPDKIRNVLYCDISNREEYNQYKKEFTEYLKQIKASDHPNKEKLLLGQFLVRMGKLRQIAARGKLQAAKEYSDMVLANGKKIVIFAHHNEIISALKEMYPKAGFVTGQDDSIVREKSIVSFQNNPDRKEIIVSNEVGGEAITLTAASDELIVETPMTDAKLEQMIARVHRIGQKECVMAAILLGRKTIDEYIYFDIVLGKRDIARIVSGDDQISKPIDLVNNLLEYLENEGN